MALLDDLSSHDLFNLVFYDTILVTPCCSQQASLLDPSTIAPAATNTTTNGFLPENGLVKNPHQQDQGSAASSSGNCRSLGSSAMMLQGHQCTKGADPEAAAVDRRRSLAEQGGRKKKRRRRARSSKNKEEADTQRMTHIAVERNRRRLMNEHLAALRSLMPHSYVQRVRLPSSKLYINCLRLQSFHVLLVHMRKARHVKMKVDD